MAQPIADSRDLLVRGAAQLGLAVDTAGVERLLIYLAELMKWSRRVNLIARDTPEAQAVLLSELHHADIPPELANLASSMSPSEYRGLMSRWRDLLRDPDGPFHQFLTSDLGSQATEFDRNATLHHMGSHGNPIKMERYLPLFQGGKMEKL